MIEVEIWSDLVCPFCYIGKRHFESALASFEGRDQVKVTWKSFQLDPSADRHSSLGTYEMLSRKYGQSVEQAKRMTAQVAERAAQVGLKFDFDRAVVTNSRDAHRLAHLAASQGMADAAEERLFSAHFCEGKNIGDPEALRALGEEIGLDADAVGRLLEGDEYAREVLKEGEEARSLGVTGVPFFVFNRKFAVSGAQPVEVFLKALNSAASEA